MIDDTIPFGGAVAQVSDGGASTTTAKKAAPLLLTPDNVVKLNTLSTIQDHIKKMSDFLEELQYIKEVQDAGSWEKAVGLCALAKIYARDKKAIETFLSGKLNGMRSEIETGIPVYFKGKKTKEFLVETNELASELTPKSDKDHYTQETLPAGKWLSETPSGRPKPTRENITTAFRRANVEVFQDVFLKDVVIMRDGAPIRSPNGELITTERSTRAWVCVMLAEEFSFTGDPTDNAIDSAITISMDENKVRNAHREEVQKCAEEYLLHVQFDDISSAMITGGLFNESGVTEKQQRYLRLDEVDYLMFGVPLSEANRRYSELTYLGIAARSIHPGCVFEFMKVNLGSQALGKSSLVNCLGLKREWVTTSLELGSNAKETGEATNSKSIVCLEEVDVRTKAQKKNAKQFLSDAFDSYTEKFSKRSITVPRGFVIMANTNIRGTIDQDLTGRRTATVECLRSSRYYGCEELYDQHLELDHSDMIAQRAKLDSHAFMAAQVRLLIGKAYLLMLGVYRASGLLGIEKAITLSDELIVSDSEAQDEHMDHSEWSDFISENAIFRAKKQYYYGKGGDMNRLNNEPVGAMYYISMNDIWNMLGITEMADRNGVNKKEMRDVIVHKINAVPNVRSSGNKRFMWEYSSAFRTDYGKHRGLKMLVYGDDVKLVDEFISKGNKI